MDNITTIILAVFASTGFWAFVQKVYDSRKKRKTPQDLMLLALGRNRLLHLSKSYLGRGYIPDDEFENYKDMGEAYLAMGGNSMVKRKYFETLELEIK